MVPKTDNLLCSIHLKGEKLPGQLHAATTFSNFVPSDISHLFPHICPFGLLAPAPIMTRQIDDTISAILFPQDFVPRGQFEKGIDSIFSLSSPGATHTCLSLPENWVVEGPLH
jgi:hypothetical protein